MPNLENQFKQWRKDMLRRQGITRSDIRELEQHLRDAMKTFQSEGIGSTMAFQKAIEAIGRPEELATEFYKVNFTRSWIRSTVVFLGGMLCLLWVISGSDSHAVNAQISSLDDLKSNELTVLAGSGIFIELRPGKLDGFVLPQSIVSNNILFFDVWLYDQLYSGLVVQHAEGDIIFVDKNRDRDFTNDGKGQYFPNSQNAVEVDLTDPSLANAPTVLCFYRYPTFLSANYRDQIFAQNGRLNSDFISFVKMSPEFTGEPRSYFFAQKRNLLRGKVDFACGTYETAICDLNLNGRYNDPEDVLLIDLNQDGRLNFSTQEELFRTDGVFKIGGTNYQIDNVNPESQYFDFVKASDSETPRPPGWWHGI